MIIEVWSDFVCPFCYIGKRRLENALEQFPYKDQVKVEFKSFELDPNSSKDVGMSMYEVLASKYGTTIEQAENMCAGVSEQANSVGLDFHFDTMIPTNTFDAHRLAKFAKTKGMEAEITEKLLFAHFTDSKHIGDHEVLVDLAVSVGLDRDEVITILGDHSAYAEEVRSNEADARQIGVQGVPFFVLNKKYAVSGAQPLEVFTGAIQKVWEEENQVTTLQELASEELTDSSCTADGCIIPNKRT